MRRPMIAVLAFLSLSCVLSRSSSAADVPTVTIMQAGSDELERDLEFLMNLAGKEGAQQWPNVQSILQVFLDGVDGSRPMRIDLILGENPDTRLSIPVSDQKAFLTNVGGYIGARERRMGGGLYLFKPKPPALQYYTRLLGPTRNPDWGIVAEDRSNLPANFQVLAAIQPLISSGFDLAAKIENSTEGVDDRRQVIVELEKEVTATLQPFEGETDNEFAMRKLGLNHQFRELERIYADSQQLVLGWTTDNEKQEGRLDLELTALEDTELAASILQLAADPSRFAAITKSDDSIFFGRINHALDAMRQKHLNEMFALMEKDANERLDASDRFNDDQKAGLRSAIENGFRMLRDGTKMGIIDGFVDVSLTDAGKGAVGAIRVADGSVAVDVLRGLKQAGWEVEIGNGAGDGGADSTSGGTGEDGSPDSPEQSAGANKLGDEADPADAAAAESDGPTDAAEADSNPETPAESSDQDLTFHTVVLPDHHAATVTSLFGSARFVIGTTADAVYYAAGQQAEERIRAAVAGGQTAGTENDGMFLEAWYRVGPILDVLRERRERHEADLDLSALSPEEKASRKERQEMRARAVQAFSDGADTIHTRIQRSENRVFGRTVFGLDILRFVGMELTNVAKTKLQ